MSPYNAVGMSKWDLDTPALCVDLDVVARNIKRIADTCKEAGVRWRPHTKGMKIPAVAHMLIDAGAVGITCAKLGEAEVMAAGGIKNILIANEIVGPVKIERLVNLLRYADVMVAVDSEENVAMLDAMARAKGQTLKVVVEVNIGIDRAGVEPGQPVVEMARKVLKYPNIQLKGVMGWEGPTRAKYDTDEERRLHITEGVELITGSAELARREGVPIEMVICGGTATYRYTCFIPGVTDVKAGGGVWGDHYYNDRFHVPHEMAMTCMSSVASRPTPTRVVTDAGRKTMDFLIQEPKPLGCGEVTHVHPSAEHGQFDLVEPNVKPGLGDKVEWSVGYTDPTVCMHDEIYGIRDGRVEVVWPIVGRGKSR
ncbi:MAG: DSD1 family PLP-dependent enzyme [Planctomycetes bacterium]|nr:DSD1 family PLP-dependent enzyme [Planctomycetota bacterium]